jgi:MFS family permease
MYGMINLVWVPSTLKFGRRPAWLLAFTIWTVSYVSLSENWMLMGSMALCSVAKTYPQLLAFSIVASIGSGICETISVIAIDDIFFLHERGTVLAYFTAARFVSPASLRSPQHTSSISPVHGDLVTTFTRPAESSL